MKKKVLSLLLVAAMGISMLVGCGGNAGSSEDNSQSGPKAITLKVWCPQNQIDSGLMAEQQAAFAEANKDKYTITWETAAVGEDVAYTEVSKDVEAAADVFFYANDQVTKFLEIGAIARLGGSTEKMVNDTMAAAVVDTVKVNGALYGIPFTHNTFFMYYDKTLLTEEDIKSLDTIVAKNTGDNVYNFLFDSAGGWKLGAWYYGAGCSVFGADGSDLAAGCDWAGKTGVAVTNYLIDLLNNKKVASSGKAEELAAEHRLGAWFDGAWAYETYYEALGEDLGMATIPTYKLEGKDVQLKGFYGSKAIGVNAQSKNMAAAVEFAAFLGSEEQQLARFEKSAQIPTNKNAAASDAVQSDPMAAVIVAEANNCSVAQPTASVFGTRYWNYADTIPTKIKSGDITKANVEKALQDMVTSMTAE